MIICCHPIKTKYACNHDYVGYAVPNNSCIHFSIILLNSMRRWLAMVHEILLNGVAIALFFYPHIYQQAENNTHLDHCDAGIYISLNCLIF